MPTTLIATSGIAGRVNVACALAQRLGSAGHDVTLAGPARLADRAKLEGVPFLGLGRASGDSRPRSLRERVQRRMANLLGGRERQVAALQLDDYAASVEALAPDLVLIDLELQPYVMMTVAMGKDTALWTDMLSLWKRRGLPPLHHNLIPGAGLRGHPVGLEWAWLRFRIWKWLRLQWNYLRHLPIDQRSVLRRVARKTGFPLAKEALWYQWLIPFTFRSLPVLELNAFELEFPHVPYPAVQYVGPVIHRERKSIRTVDPADRRRLDEIYEARATGKVSALVYAAFGAWHGGDESPLFRHLAEAVGGRPDWTLILGLGAKVDRERIGSLPPNVHALEWAPQFEILEHADLALHHGGINTINECLIRGVPMIAYPIAGRDTVGAALRMAYHGLGILGDRRKDTPDVIQARIAALLEDAHTASRVDWFRDRLVEYEDARVVERAVESIIGPSGG